MYLLDKIIEKCEYHSKKDWKPGEIGNRKITIQQEDYTKYGKTEFINEAQDLAKRKLIQIKWEIRYSDIREIQYSLEQLPQLYQLAEQEAQENGETFVPKYCLVQQYQDKIEAEQKQGWKNDWIRKYYDSLLQKLHNIGDRKVPKELEKFELYRDCLRGIDALDEPIFKRVFSKRYLGDTKKFEKEVQAHIITSAKKYCEDVEEDMDDSTVLEQLLIKEYGQEMALKGSLKLLIHEADGTDREINTANFKYGLILNTQTLKHVSVKNEIVPFKCIVSIENKANFEAMNYSEDTLYVYSHGYYGPYERAFLQKLAEILDANQQIEYFHSGDLDYGGVKIFEYIQKRIFPKLHPLNMDIDTYEKYKDFAEPIEAQILEKLKKTKVSVLQELIDKLIEEGKGLEQEIFTIELDGL